MIIYYIQAIYNVHEIGTILYRHILQFIPVGFFLHPFLFIYPRSQKGEGGILFYLCPSVRPRYFSSHFSQLLLMAEIWYLVTSVIYKKCMYTILWVVFLDPSDSYFLFADLVGFYAHWTYMHIFRHIFLSNYWWQKSDIWS